MKLYNTYKELILEGVKDTLINVLTPKQTENGTNYYNSATIWYRDKKGNLEERYVFIYGIGINKAGNEVIRGFQAFGGTNTKNSKWKTFLVDRISKIKVHGMKFYKPPHDLAGGASIPKYVGPSDASMKSGQLSNAIKYNSNNKNFNT